jgi:assimilatory nitrate reductase catalytic subunit
VHPVLFQRIKAAKKQRPSMKIVVIDPRSTPTCDIADLHLPLQSGTDAFLFNGLLAYLARLGELDLRYLEAHVEGFGETLHHARTTASDLTALARTCGLQEAAVAQFFDLFRRHEKVVTAYSQGINQSSSGSDKVNAIINCHLATGRIGKPGMGPFSLTGQPNAMGGREVGGLANQLAAHMDFAPADIDRVQRFWGAPAIAKQPGLKAVDLFDAMHSGKIRAVWIMGTNPVVSMPKADKVAEALRRCPLVIVSDCIEHTDTTAFAHVLLPAQGWGEKDGTVTNSERCISRQRQIVKPFAEARPDWWIVTQVAQRLGFAKDFPYQTAHEIFIEHAKLSAFENDEQGKRRDFNLSGLTQLDKPGYDALHPVQWPVLPECPEGTRRLFENGQFFTPSGKARMLPINPALPKGETNSSYPLILNTGRIRDQWHSMTRTALSPRLNQHIDEPVCQIHPADAMANQLRNNTLVRIETATGHSLARLLITEKQRPGSLFLPMHWTRQNSAQGRIGPLVNAFTDPFSGQPESKHTPARVSTWKPLWQAFVFTRYPVKPDAAYWVQIPCDGFMRFEIADTLPLSAPAEWIKQLLPAGDTEAHEWLEYHDQNSGQHRVALTLDDRLEACIFYSSGKALPDHSWISKLLKQESLSAADRMCLLSARPPQGSALEGKMVCACFSVGEFTICRTIQEKSLRSVEAVGACLQAGTNCGSCLPELKKLLDQTVAR